MAEKWAWSLNFSRALRAQLLGNPLRKAWLRPWLLLVYKKPLVLQVVVMFIATFWLPLQLKAHYKDYYQSTVVTTTYTGDDMV